MNMNAIDVSEAIEAADRCIESTDALFIAAGAGFGVDSGFPDFRGGEGPWRAYPRLKHLGLSVEGLANPLWFEKGPKLAWAFYGHRQRLYR
jgi:NAD-dependent SIR2 family protein deacetylase